MFPRCINSSSHHQGLFIVSSRTRYRRGAPPVVPSSERSTQITVEKLSSPPRLGGSDAVCVVVVVYSVYSCRERLPLSGAGLEVRVAFGGPGPK